MDGWMDGWIVLRLKGGVERTLNIINLDFVWL